MKKSLPFFVLLCIGYSNLFSQTNVYKPFPQVYSSWIVEKSGPWGPGLGTFYSWKKYVAMGDTIIGAYSYKKVSVADNTGYPNYPNPAPFGPSTFDFAYRNDIAAKKVYYLDVTGGNKDTLWYDYNLNVGDTLHDTYAFKNIYGINANARSIVSSIDSMLICGTYYKRFNFNCSIGFETQLIEGMGFLDKFIKTEYLDCPFEPYYIYHTDFSTCISTSINESNSLKKIIQLYPNPVTTELKIKDAQTFCNYSIINNLGKLILKGSYLDKESINVANLPNGLYIIELHDKQGNVYQSKFIKQ